MKKTNHMTIEEIHKYVNERNAKNINCHHIHIEIAGHKGFILYMGWNAGNNVKAKLSAYLETEEAINEFMKIQFPFKDGAYIETEFPLQEKLINGGILTTYHHYVKITTCTL